MFFLFKFYLFTLIYLILFCTFLREIEIHEISTTKTWRKGGKKENDPYFGLAKIGTDL